MERVDWESSLDWDSISEITSSFAETTRVLFSAGGVTETLTRIVDFATATIDGCDQAEIFLDDRTTAPPSAATVRGVMTLNEWQRRSNHGPSLEASTNQHVVFIDDLEGDGRWPNFERRAVKAGMRSLVALPVSYEAGRGALTLYARARAAFGVVDRAKAAILVPLTGVALTAALSRDDEERRAINFQAALASRETIGEALGILMERERITSEQAFDVLRRASHHLDLKLRQVAQNLIDTGESPKTE